MSNTGQPVKLSRPLDFLVVADHSDNMGLYTDLAAGKPELIANPKGRRWYDMIQSGKGGEAALEMIFSFGDGSFPKEMIYQPDTSAYRTAWQGEIKAAEEYNDPGRFTAFIGFEWTSNAQANNLHRNVVFRGNGAQAGLVVPMVTFKPFGSDNPEDLWKWMAATEEKTGSEVLAIAHNGNMSNGIMFPMVEAFGKKIDKGYVETRARWEPLYEMTQTKGTGEAHPYLSPNDEFANFETLGQVQPGRQHSEDQGDAPVRVRPRGAQERPRARVEVRHEPVQVRHDRQLDAHTGLAAMEEENFFGKTTPQEPSPERMTKTFVKHPKSGVTVMDWEVSSSGYAAVWATENTREAIFDAMKRRETYATTGPRMAVRLFGGWDFEPADANNRMPAAIGYAKGVPMGGDLRTAPEGQVADVHRRGAQGRDRREPRPHPDHQGLGRQGRQDAGARLRRGRLRRAHDRQGRPLQDRGRHHGRRGERDVDQHDRRAGADHGLEGPGLRPGAAGVLLRARARDPDAALDRLRREALRHQAPPGHDDDAAGAGLHLADLVHAVGTSEAGRHVGCAAEGGRYEEQGCSLPVKGAL